MNFKNFLKLFIYSKITIFLLSTSLTYSQEKTSSEVKKETTQTETKKQNIYQQQINKLKKQAEQFVKQNNELEEKINEIDQELKKLPDIMNQTINRIEQIEQQIKSLPQITTHLKETNNAISDLNTKLTETQISLGILSSIVDDFRIKISTLQITIKNEKEKNIEGIVKKISSNLLVIQTDIELLKKETIKIKERYAIERSTHIVDNSQLTDEEKQTFSDKIITKIRETSQSKWLAPVAIIISVIAFFK